MTETDGSTLEVVGAVSLGVASLAGLLWWERRTPEPMLPLGLFCNTAFTLANATSFAQFAALSGSAFLVVQYLQNVAGYSPVSAGLRLLPWTAMPMLVAPLAGSVSDRIGRWPVMTVGMLLQALALASFGLLAAHGGSYVQLGPVLLVAGVGLSMVLATAPTAALSAVHAVDLSKAAGVNGTLQRFGSAFGIALASAVFAAHGDLATVSHFEAGLEPAMEAAALFALLGAVSACLLGVRARALGTRAATFAISR
jgi:hypothetical protein